MPFSRHREQDPSESDFSAFRRSTDASVERIESRLSAVEAAIQKLQQFLWATLLFQGFDVTTQLTGIPRNPSVPRPLPPGFVSSPEVSGLETTGDACPISAE